MSAQPSLLAGSAGAAAVPDADVAAGPHQLWGLLRRSRGCKTPVGPRGWGLGTVGTALVLLWSSRSVWRTLPGMHGLGPGGTARGSPLELQEFLGNTLRTHHVLGVESESCYPFPLRRFCDSRIFLLQNSHCVSPLGCRVQTLAPRTNLSSLQTSQDTFKPQKLVYSPPAPEEGH